MQDTGKSIAGLECKVKPGHHAALPHWNANSMLALQFMLWQLRSRDLTVVLRVRRQPSTTAPWLPSLISNVITPALPTFLNQFSTVPPRAA